ncbi:hypothetical protein FB45DRAFT_1064552 [Roridomyces roridus]|uniref:F-box domain-containing protein n=1 Tax=Roridomyces roridus TaxID=1738132 RepID=A0AAD7BAA9_9AGAR|nr:hypothetical protein FB45DRAFT_1064552 [Roridomyces roridus]
MSILKIFLSARRLRPPPTKTPSLAQDLHPVEIWNAIFSHLPDHQSLLRTARVCRAFNVLCVDLYLAQNNIASLSRSLSLELYSGMLPVVRLSCIPTLPMERIACSFACVGVQRSLSTMRDVIRKSPALLRVDLTFRHDLLKTYELDTWVRSDWRMLRELYRVLAAMADRSPGEVVVFAGNTVYVGCAGDVGEWKLGGQTRQTRPVLRARNILQRLVLRKRRIVEDEATTLPRTNGTYPGHLQLFHIFSVTVNSLPGHTLMVFDSSTIDTLYLNSTPIYTSLLSALLPLLDLPALHQLSVPDGLIPEALSSFLIRHPTLRSFRHESRGRSESSGPLIESPPTMEHPGLHELIAHGIPNITRALNALGRSPNLHIFEFILYPSVNENLSTLSMVLRIIGELRPADRKLPTHLSLKIKNPPSPDISADQFFQHSTDSTATTRALNSVQIVTITCWSQDMAHASLPWLALLPALQKARFWLHLEDGRAPPQFRATYEEFREPAMRALPGVEVQVSAVLGRERGG